MMCSVQGNTRMKKIMLSLIVGCFAATGSAQSSITTNRIPQFSNNAVNVWKTIIYPRAEHTLSMHRHAHDRVLVALTDGVLKIINNHGKIHYLRLKKDTAYFLKKDVPQETHTDENISMHPIKVMVIELK